ncbi:MAG: phosphoribosylglycinamide formyltransferase [Phycisphaerales bacterium]|nr:phosphoribosylglycinamide formyltransferase [Phycisphaerae bacterium]NNF44408.1 phosphoribosylglycinamide formyltransferase [Phycisphaerales bacterium]NNM25816.1 phosphoribosylglycinamide formyltransferase [Phycisphaerales bacterium]
MTRTLPIAGLISGGGRTLLNLAAAIDDGRLDASIELVISSRANATGVERAEARGLDVRIAAPGDFRDDTHRHDSITAWLEAAGVELVCGCGYLQWIRVDPPFAGRMINIHPALLPDFGGPGMYGLHVHRAVLEAGRTESGCTVHVVDEAYDHGPTILQRRCPVKPGDTPEELAARVFVEECHAYPEAVQRIADGRVRIESGRVVQGERGSGSITRP